MFKGFHRPPLDNKIVPPWVTLRGKNSQGMLDWKMPPPRDISKTSPIQCIKT